MILQERISAGQSVFEARAEVQRHARADRGDVILCVYIYVTMRLLVCCDRGVHGAAGAAHEVTRGCCTRTWGVQAWRGALRSPLLRTRRDWCSCVTCSLV